MKSIPMMPTTNALTNVDAKWIGDGKDGEFQQDSACLTIQSNRRGTPFNLRHDCNLGVSDDWCFQVVLDSVPPNSSISVGIVHPEEMLPGWKTRGMFYNGNLTNGGAALITAFGPYLKEGDTVEVSVTNHNRDVTFHINGKCLGTGFSLLECGKVYCPCIHVSGEVKVTFVIPETLPPAVTRERNTEGMADEWKLIEAVNESGTQVNIPSDRDIILHVDDDDASVYKLSIRVGNTLRCNVMKQKDGSVKVGPMMSTLMEPPPELRELETFVSSFFPNVTSIDLLEQNLVLSDAFKMKFVFERFVKKVKPLEKY
jgi:hypothetical protein